MDFKLHLPNLKKTWLLYGSRYIQILCDNRKIEAKRNWADISVDFENAFIWPLISSRSEWGRLLWGWPPIFVNRHSFDLPKARVGQKSAGFFPARQHQMNPYSFDLPRNNFFSIRILLTYECVLCGLGQSNADHFEWTFLFHRHILILETLIINSFEWTILKLMSVAF